MAFSSRQQSLGTSRSAHSPAYRQAESHVPAKMTVNITVVSATGLRKKDLLGMPDPFVKLVISGVTQESKPCRKTLSPTWSEKFQFKVNPSATLNISVWNFRKIGKSPTSGFMGYTDIPLAFLTELESSFGKRSGSFSLKTKHGAKEGSSCGDIFIEFEVRRDRVSESRVRNLSRTQTMGVAQPRQRSMSIGTQSPHRTNSSTNVVTTTTLTTSPRSPTTAVTRAISLDPGPNRSLSFRTSSHNNSTGLTQPAVRRTEAQVKTFQNMDVGLPEGWEMRITPSGRTYYAHHRTKRTQWERPAPPTPEPSPSPVGDREDYGRRSLLMNGVDEEGFGFPMSPPNRMSNNTSARSNTLDGPTTSNARVNQLSMIRQLSQDDRSTNSAPPLSPPSTSSLALRRLRGSDPTSQTTQQGDTNKDKLSNSLQSPYTRHWEEYIIEDNIDEFPIGWEMRQTAGGRPYYVDHINRATTFEDPRVKHREERIKQAMAHDKALPKYKRDIRRKLLRLRDLFVHQSLQYEKALGSNPNKQKLLQVDIVVSRENILEDSFRCIMKAKPHQLIGKLNITFLNEDALDYGGVSREWFFLLSKAMLDPNFALFEPAGNEQYLLKINPQSSINPQHIEWFHFVGRVLGLAVKHAHYIQGAFVMPLYKMLLGTTVTLKDMEQVDPTFHGSLLWMLENNITDIIDNSFADEQLSFGEIQIIELKKGGADIPVTEENKFEYVELIVKHRLQHEIRHQCRALKKGFDEVVPPRFMSMFDEKELELIICGLGEIDLDDWSLNTDYRNCTEDDQLVKWFWQLIREMENETRARLLQFVTGTSRVPVTGFEDLKGSLGPKKFTLEYVEGEEVDSLPKAHTCFNRIDLPKYSSYANLESKLTIAIENTIGFGIE